MRECIIFDCPHADCRTPIDTGKCRKECLERYNKEMGSKPKTNADRIRAMSDEELAELLSNYCRNTQDCYYCDFLGKCPGVAGDWDKWLQQPAEGE